MIQTFDPKNPLFDFLKRHDYLSLYNQQIEERRLFAFPPFYRIIQLTIKHRDSQRIGMASELLRLQLNQVFGERISSIITPTIARVQNMHMRQIRIRLEAKANLTHAKKLLLEQINYVRQHPNGKGCIIHADVDPM
jgi:primosomal protein N' (replication factor Y)